MSYNILSCVEVQTTVCDHTLYFDRRNLPDTVPVLECLLADKQHLSVKQVPSALTLRKTGISSMKRNLLDLQKDGFSFSEARLGEPLRGAIPTKTASSITSGQISYLQDYLHNMNEPVEPDIESYDYMSDTGDDTESQKPVDVKEDKDFHLVYNYDDPFKIFASRIYGEAKGLTLPPLNVWEGDLYRLQDDVPQRLLPKSWAPRKLSKNKISFSKIRNISIKIDFLRERTFWGNTLTTLTASKDGGTSRWAKTLWKRLRHFLEGKPDPLWKDAGLIYTKPNNLRSSKVRANRLIEVLKVVDGMFLQRFLTTPEEEWTWEKFDKFILYNLSFLISDEFYDGELTDDAALTITYYQQLKTARKYFKGKTSKNVDLLSHPGEYNLPRWLNQLRGQWAHVTGERTPQETFLQGMLSQTRGMGSPPLLVVLQSEVKFIETVTQPVIPITKTVKLMLKHACQDVINNIPAHVFTGLSTKARVTVATTSCWENTKRDGGTIAAISYMLLKRSCYQIPIRNLDDSTITKVDKTTLSIGEQIFWISLHEVLTTPLEVLRAVWLLIIKEPAKARTVTKTKACLKTVLNVINKICSWPLQKGVDSSESGMGKAHHGWNFFKSLYEDEEALFEQIPGSTRVREYVGSKEIEIFYKALYTASTDYSTATDFVQHDVASTIGNEWMIACGIPNVLRGIVNAVCYQPRTVFFRARGPMKQYGENVENDINKITLVRGILMGDPLTKVVLHLINIIVRQLAKSLLDPAFLSRCTTDSIRISSTLRDLRHYVDDHVDHA